VPVIASNGTWIGFDGRTVGAFVENQLWSWGSGLGGRLGDGAQTGRISAVREFCLATNWCQVTGGVFNTAAIKTSGELWLWGGNNCGLLGDGTTTATCSPVREFCSATDWCQVSGGCFHTVAVKTSGELWVWGGNACGVVGDGTLTSRCSPVREFCSATDWCQVSAGERHTAAVKISGQIWSWGSGNGGRLGDGTSTNRYIPVREFCSAADWCQVSAGQCQSAAIKTSGELWVWGGNNYATLGDGTTTTRCSPVREFCSATDWCQASANLNHTAAVKTSGEIWTWGRNTCGQSGNGNTTQLCSPVREICSATDWFQVTAGGFHTAAIKTSGQLWAWGGNVCGSLGDGTTLNRCSPVREFCSATDWCQVSGGSCHTAAIKSVTVVCR